MDKEQENKRTRVRTMEQWDNKTKESNLKGTMEELEIWYVTGALYVLKLRTLARTARVQPEIKSIRPWNV